MDKCDCCGKETRKLTLAEEGNDKLQLCDDCLKEFVKGHADFFDNCKELSKP